MAIVINKDGQGIIANGFYGVVDRKYETPNRGGAGFPAIQAQYAGELMVNGTTGEIYRAMDSNASPLWVETNIR
jgi:hypothetical protein